MIYNYKSKRLLRNMLIEQIYETAKKSAITIISYYFNGDALATGSGVVISDDGKIISNLMMQEIRLQNLQNFILQKEYTVHYII